MSILLWIIAGWHVLSALVVVSMVGEPRKPITPGTAVYAVLVQAFFVTVLAISAIQGVTP